MLREPAFVVVANDDHGALAAQRDALRLAGAQVAACKKVSVALESIAFHLPTVVIADPAMEGGQGWEVVYAARAAGHLPTIVLDRAGDAATRRTAFAAGADDVVRAGVEPDELATRVLALAGRARPTGASGPVHRLRGLVVDVAAHSVRHHGRPVVVTAQQFAILLALFEANGATLERARLLARIEGLDDEPPSERAIDLHVTRLRRRLRDSAKEPRYIESVYGVGYRLVTEAVPPAELGDQAEDVLAALPDPLLVIDTQLRVRFANDAVARLLARPRSEIVGQRCGDVLECADCLGARIEGARCFARAVQAGGAPLRDVPAQVRAGDGPIPVWLTYNSVQGDGLLTLEIRRRDGSPTGSTASA